jgi:hypothetical protein
MAHLWRQQEQPTARDIVDAPFSALVLFILRQQFFPLPLFLSFASHHATL